MPTNRGFDSYMGSLGTWIDYFDYTYIDYRARPMHSRGYDMRRNLTVAKDVDPIYVTRLYTKEALKIIAENDGSPFFLSLNHNAPHAANEDVPFQAPAETIAKFPHILNPFRKILAAMVSEVDDSVGSVVKALKDKNLLENTIIVFYSDNGGQTFGQHSTFASNFPLRGQKASGWEGGTRAAALLYSADLNDHGVVRNQLMHVSDLFPTLLRRAGVDVEGIPNLDGIDQWDVITNGDEARRSQVVFIDDVQKYGMLRQGPYKLVQGTISYGIFDWWLSNKHINARGSENGYAASVLNSPAAQAFFDLPTHQSDPLTVEKILRLRTKAKVNCGE